MIVNISLTLIFLRITLPLTRKARSAVQRVPMACVMWITKHSLPAYLLSAFATLTLPSETGYDPGPIRPDSPHSVAIPGQPHVQPRDPPELTNCKRR